MLNFINECLDFISIQTILVFIATFLSAYFITRRRPGVPPGPPLWPIIGNLPTLAADDMFKTLNGLTREYGNIFGLYIGNELYIFLNGYDIVHDALVKKGRDFVYRPSNSAFYKRVLKHPGINQANGPLWKKERDFTQMAFNKLCYSNGGTCLEHIINCETTCLIARLKKLSRQRRGCVDNINDINSCTMNIILQILYGQRFDYDDDRGNRLLQTLNKMVEEVSKMLVLCNCFPWILYLPTDLLGINSLEKRYQSDIKLLQTVANLPYNNMNIDNPGRYIDMYKKRELKNENTVLDYDLLEDQVDITCYDLIGAGSETSATVLTWIVLYLIRQPNIQEKMFQEIMKHIGKDRQPMLDDREKLPYVQAVICEGLRLGNVVPFGLPRSVIRDTYFQGYIFPQDCHIIFNFDSVLRDPNVFVEPDEFRPERFLDSTCTRLQIPTEFIPFNMGPRACVGQTLARMELFLLISNLVHNFEFLPADNGQVPDLAYHIDLTRKPNAFSMTIKERVY